MSQQNWWIIFFLALFSFWVKGEEEMVVRDDHLTLSLGYQHISSWVPAKKIMGLTYILNPRLGIEAEYSWSSLDSPDYGTGLKQIKENRGSLFARYYLKGAFHFILGVFMNDLTAQLDKDLFYSPNETQNSTLKAGQGGLSLGLGSRWILSHGITLGVDWIRINQPLIETLRRDRALKKISDPEDIKVIQRALQNFKQLPSFVLFGLSVGYSF